MHKDHFIRLGLYAQSLPIYETDIPYIQNILSTIEQSEDSLNTFPYLNQEVPITIIDKELLL